VRRQNRHQTEAELCGSQRAETKTITRRPEHAGAGEKKENQVKALAHVESAVMVRGVHFHDVESPMKLKNTLVAVSLIALISGCTSVETTTVGGNEVVGNGGEAVAVIQATSLGFAAIFNLIQVVQSDLDQIINRVLVAEAKNMGATKIDLKSAQTTPRHGIFAVLSSIAPSFIPFLLSFPSSQAVAVAVK
jgi:hypothetical protein